MKTHKHHDTTSLNGRTSWPKWQSGLVLLSAAALAANGAVSTADADPPADRTFLVVTSHLAAQSPEWQDVSAALADKHAHEARVIRLSARADLTNELAAIRVARPTHVAFVMRPEEVVFPSVVALKRMMRALDDDPYDDAIWGIVTGPTAEAARRIASSREPRTITAMLATTGVSDSVISGSIACLDDRPPGSWRVKSADGAIVRHPATNDLSHVFADAWNDLDPDFIITGFHASQRNLEMPFGRGNIVPRGGVFQTLPNAKLIDYSTGQAKKDALRNRHGMTRLKEPGREKVWLAVGNCLIADNLRSGENMVMTALGFGKVNQFVGYTATTWFGEIGWTTWSLFREGHSLVDAYFTANRRLIRELEETMPEAKDFLPVFKNAKDYEQLIRTANAFGPLARVTDKRKAIGRLWDRDATVFYGDPLQKVYLNSAGSPERR